ncbi:MULTISPECIES: hypothetical protein [unclassified Mesorhizobium]|uniref:hypothetical protein n=1 Tax=unclassified Mesorhizobium TaxID=325217 RepID=UPI00241768B1|nr:MULTISPECIES: hypothetical protein [unclassified Mesorhizobium]MDG4902799.1 hypothetical protein [Mesorhizobium sp. WSM4962]MDG4920808.1 hypothetical protein [Mesorhizobium sp. WSM4989]
MSENITAPADGGALPAANLNRRAAPKIEELPFIGRRKKDESGNLRRHFWRVQPSGNYVADCKTGGSLALLYLAFEEADREGHGILGFIVSDMPREFTGIEVGFLQMVAFAASAGAYRARQIDAYWKKAAAALNGGAA